jgi:single-stranded DNA-binding protein
MGNVGKDPTENTIPASEKVSESFTVLDFPLATEKRIKLPDGTFDKQVQWHRISTTLPSAKSLGKGDRVLIEGEIKYWKSENSHGTMIKGHLLTILRKGNASAPAESENKDNGFGGPKFGENPSQ